MILFLTGIFYLIIWGFDFKFDYDSITWVWLSSGLFYRAAGAG